MCGVLYAVLSNWIVYFTPWKKKNKNKLEIEKLMARKSLKPVRKTKARKSS